MPDSTGPAPFDQADLPRRLGPWSALGLVVGITIGSGIFRTPSVIAGRVPDATLMLLVWVAGGLISLCGALSVAELAAAFPRSGGWYTFVREGWGRLAGFLFGWSELVLIRASATGAMALVFSSYLLQTVGRGGAGDRLTGHLAAGAIVIAAAANIRGVRLGAYVAGLSSIAKFGGLAALVFVAFAFGGYAQPAADASGGVAVQAAPFGLALVSVLWAYDGFADVSFAAGEVLDPRRTLPRAIIGGLIAIVVIYVAANLAYLHLLPVKTLAQSPFVAADAMRTIAGERGAVLVSLLVTISTGGALFGVMLVAPRIFFAMAEEGLFFRVIGAVHPGYRTPYVAILLSAALGVFFVLTRTFEQLADTFVLSIWPFYGLAIAGLYRLRRRRREPSGYRVPGYPVVPGIFVAAVCYLVGSALVADPRSTLLTFAIVLAGVPVYVVFFRQASA